MTRGNQRDLAREKAAKKAGKGKSANDTAANAGKVKEVFRTCNVLPFSCTHLALSTKAR